MQFITKKTTINFLGETRRKIAIGFSILLASLALSDLHDVVTKKTNETKNKINFGYNSFKACLKIFIIVIDYLVVLKI